MLYGIISLGETTPIVDGTVISSGVASLTASIQSMMPVVLPILFLVLGYKFIPKIVKMFAK